MIDNPRADLLPFADLWRRWRRWWSRADAPRPCLGDNAFSHDGRRRSWPRPSSLNRLDVALAQDQGPCLRWSTGFIAHEMRHPGLAFYLFPDGNLDIAAPGHGGRRGARPSLLPALVVDLFVAGRRRSPHGRASWRFIVVVDVTLLVAAEGLRHGGCCLCRGSGAWLQTGDRHKLDGFGWRAETWRPSLGKRLVPCRSTVEVIVGPGNCLPCETALRGGYRYDLGEIGPDARPGQGQVGRVTRRSRLPSLGGGLLLRRGGGGGGGGEEVRSKDKWV